MMCHFAARAGSRFKSSQMLVLAVRGTGQMFAQVTLPPTNVSLAKLL
jgi:hypothetical protein